MEHPFIVSLADKSIEELQTSLTDLHSKLTFAYRSGNLALITQLNMVIESYRNEHSKRMDELFKKQNINTQINVEKGN